MLYYILTSLFAPLLAFFVAGVFSHSKKSALVGMVCSLLIILSTLSSFMLLEIVVSSGAIVLYLDEFIHIGILNIDYAFVIDHVSSIMMVTVGVVSSIVHVYSIGYMEHDRGFNRYFSYLGLFVFSMLVLVMSDNFIGLFIGWEGVGLCSWLLIGFWYEKKGVSWCANEAFIMNRVADLGMLLGIFLIYTQVGSLKYDIVFASVENINNAVLVWIGILLFIGAMGKSAQFPFHTWLADAMAGPTPVSALIHAATMVTAGVYLVIRANGIFTPIPEVGHFIACLGAFVAVFAASMALVENDLKKIVAYSTLSQLGYMFVAAGLGAYWIALFHLMTHAFFKSLLFLGAGNVMHAMEDELNIQKMGGLYKHMKFTAILMVVASLALAGFYPFAGFFSKDKILEVAFNGENYFLWFLLFLGAMMTAFYSFRLIMLVFFGKEKFSHHPHEAKTFMLIAMAPLGLLAIISGFFEHSFVEFTTAMLPKYNFTLDHNIAVMLIVATLAAVFASTIFAIFAYKKELFKENIARSKIYILLSSGYFIPKFYQKVFIDGYYKISALLAKIDEKIIDASVDMVANCILKISESTNKMQNGDLSRMLKLMVIGFVLLLILALVI